jgi:hypothetical protein
MRQNVTLALHGAQDNRLDVLYLLVQFANGSVGRHCRHRLDLGDNQQRIYPVNRDVNRSVANRNDRLDRQSESKRRATNTTAVGIMNESSVIDTTRQR